MATMPLENGAEMSTGQRAACQRTEDMMPERAFHKRGLHKRTHRSAIRDEPLQLLLQQTDGSGGPEWHVAEVG